MAESLGFRDTNNSGLSDKAEKACFESATIPPKSKIAMNASTFPILLYFMWFLVGCSSLDHEAILVLEDLAAGAEPTRLKAETPRPERSAIHYSVDGRGYHGDI